jgi:hypothetical protein
MRAGIQEGFLAARYPWIPDLISPFKKKGGIRPE